MGLAFINIIIVVMEEEEEDARHDCFRQPALL